MKQTFAYLRYFFYLAYNWNIRIAIHVIRNEIKGEKKYGIQTTGADELQVLEDKGIDISHATIYMPAGYDLLEILLKEIQAFKPVHFIDIGCGKGRAMCVAAHYGIPKITGIDFSKELAEAARNNMAHTQGLFPAQQYKVIHNDAFYFDIPEDADCIFFFNPFDEVIMLGVIGNIEKSIRLHKRTLYIVYINPLHKDLFLQHGYREIFHTKKMKYLEASILKKGR